MRYSEIDLQCEDIIWFGVDSNQHIFACFSGGIGCVPEFVCRSREETEILLEYFTEKMPINTEGNLCKPQQDNQLVEDCLSLSSRGIYCFDVDTNESYGDFYKKISYPARAIVLSELPIDIKRFLSDHTIAADASSADKLVVSHAY